MARAMLIALLAALVALPAVHANETTTYTASMICAWNDDDFRVLVVPPANGAIYQYDPTVGSLPGGLRIVAGVPDAPWDSEYTQAAVEGILQWKTAFAAYAAAHPEASHLADITISVDVASPGLEIDTSHYDAIVIFPTTQDAGGRASQWCNGLEGMQRPSAIIMSTWFVYSYTANDVYNIVMHEFGHTLGLNHVTDAPTDLMQPVYGHFIGYQTNPRECISTLNLAMLAEGFAWMRGTPFVVFPEDITMDPADYAKVC